MAITLESTPLNAAVDTVAALFDGGSVEFLDGATVLVALTLAADVFPGATAGSTDATLSSNPPYGNVVVVGVVTATGTCDGFQVKNSGGTVILTGSVSTVGGGGSFELSSVDFGVGDTVVVSTMTYSQPATGA
jgi:hypothetical protein